MAQDKLAQCKAVTKSVRVWTSSRMAVISFRSACIVVGTLLIHPLPTLSKSCENSTSEFVYEYENSGCVYIRSTGSASATRSWSENECRTLGQGGWRLPKLDNQPTIDALHAIISHVDKSQFPASATSAVFWTDLLRVHSIDHTPQSWRWTSDGTTMNDESLTAKITPWTTGQRNSDEDFCAIVLLPQFQSNGGDVSVQWNEWPCEIKPDLSKFGASVYLVVCQYSERESGSDPHEVGLGIGIGIGIGIVVIWLTIGVVAAIVVYVLGRRRKTPPKTPRTTSYGIPSSAEVKPAPENAVDEPPEPEPVVEKKKLAWEVGKDGYLKLKPLPSFPLEMKAMSPRAPIVWKEPVELVLRKSKSPQAPPRIFKMDKSPDQPLGDINDPDAPSYEAVIPKYAKELAMSKLKSKVQGVT